MKLVWRSLKITLWVQLVLSIYMIVGTMVKGDENPMGNFHYGVYISVLSLQFFPFIFLAIVIILLILRFLKQRKVQ